MSSVIIQDLHVYFGSLMAVNGIDLEVREGEFLTLLGASGCGKTTTLRVVAGFVTPTSGRVRMGDADVTGLPPQKRNIGMVFQEYVLFPHMTVKENIAFGLRERRTPTAAVNRRGDELLEVVQLPGTADRYPSQLSGGQQQRVALARALAFHPSVLLMDEPLGALDLKLRESMQTEIRRIQKAVGITTIYVTHDQGEALSMSDRIAVMNAGRIEQLGTPTEIYRHPRTLFVAGFVGSMNLIRGTAENGSVRCPSGIAVPAATAGRGNVTLGIRPEAVRILPASETGPDTVPGVVESLKFHGNNVQYFIRVAADLVIQVEAPGEELVAPNSNVRLRLPPEHFTVWPGHGSEQTHGSQSAEEVAS